MLEKLKDFSGIFLMVCAFSLFILIFLGAAEGDCWGGRRGETWVCSGEPGQGIGELVITHPFITFASLLIVSILLFSFSEKREKSSN